MRCVEALGRSFRDDVAQPVADAARSAFGVGCFTLAAACFVAGVALDAGSVVLGNDSYWGLEIPLWVGALVVARSLAAFDRRSRASGARVRHPFFSGTFWLVVSTLTIVVCAATWLVGGMPYGALEAAVEMSSDLACIMGSFLAACERRDPPRVAYA